MFFTTMPLNFFTSLQIDHNEHDQDTAEKSIQKKRWRDSEAQKERRKETACGDLNDRVNPADFLLAVPAPGLLKQVAEKGYVFLPAQAMTTGWAGRAWSHHRGPSGQAKDADVQKASDCQANQEKEDSSTSVEQHERSIIRKARDGVEKRGWSTQEKGRLRCGPVSFIRSKS